MGFGTVGVTGSGARYELRDDGSSRLEVWEASGARAALELSAADTAALAAHLTAPAPAESVDPEPEPVNAAPAAVEPVVEAEPVEAEPAPAEEPDA